MALRQLKSKFLTQGGIKAAKMTKGGPMNKGSFTMNDKEQKLQRVHAPKTMNDKSFNSKPLYGNGSPKAGLEGFYGQKVKGNPDTMTPGQMGPGAQKKVGPGSIRATGPSKKPAGNLANSSKATPKNSPEGL